MTLPERKVELIDTPENVQKMLNVASRVERAIFRKKKITPGHYVLWFRAKEPPNDLLAAIKRRAGLTKKRTRRSKPKVEQVQTGESD